MSILSSPGSLAPDQAEAYTAAILELLGAQDPLRVLRETPAALKGAVERLSPAELDQPEAAGKWSTREVVQHLADAELVGAYRIRMVLAHDRPSISSYDQDLWASRLHYRDVDVRDALDQFTVLRRANLRYWAGASATELARVGIHSERGEESLELMRRLYAGHDLAHRRQLARIRIVVTGV